MELKRFLVTDKSGDYVATVYAEEFSVYAGVDSFTGASGGHFWIGGVIVGSADLAKHNVGDSGGRMHVNLDSFIV